MDATAETSPITEHEEEQVARANAATSTPVVFVHGRDVAETALEFVRRFT
jgi:hypothetical protein